MLAGCNNTSGTKDGDHTQITAYRGKVLCKKSMDNYNRLNLVHPDYLNLECEDPENYRTCGSSLTDRVFRTCFPKDIACPINGIQIVPANDSVIECY